MSINHGPAVVPAGAVTAAGAGLALLAREEASKSQDLARDGWYIVPLIIGVVGFLALIVILALWGFSAVRQWRTRHPSRRKTRADAARRQQDRVNAAAEAKAKLDLKIAEQAEANKNYRAVPQMGTPPVPWGSESVILWLHVPNSDTFTSHVGETVWCEVWRSAYAYRTTNEIPYDPDHGCFSGVSKRFCGAARSLAPEPRPEP